jgi:small subunit ribosomal protein S20
VTQSALKALRRDRRRRQVNKLIRSRLKMALKKAKQNPTKKSLTLATSSLDRAAKKKVIHKNKAARLKSRLAKLSKKS